MNKFAFTLAEVLITLGIIGVIAAITLSSLIQNYQKQEVASKLKKSYANLQNALQASIAENGDMTTWDFSSNLDHSGVESNYFFNKYIVPYYKNIKKSNQNYIIKSIDGVNSQHALNNITLTDGTLIAIGLKYQRYMWMYIDINADKGPNRLGKDIFMLSIYPKSNKLIFHSQGQTNAQLKSNYDGGGYQCAKGTNTTYAGAKCGAKIMLDGWKISDDYPW